MSKEGSYMNARTGKKPRVAKIERKTYGVSASGGLNQMTLFRETLKKLTKDIGYAKNRAVMRSTIGRTKPLSKLP
jgi:hypothetical protein